MTARTSAGPSGGQARSRRPQAPSQDVAVLTALRTARDRIDARFAEPFDVSTLARSIGYSRAHFIRAFRAAYGESPGAYRTRRRIERASDLLRSTDMAVTDICLAVGFSSLGAFSSRFSAVTKLSPQAYRRTARSEAGAAAIPACFALMWRTGLTASAQANAARSEKPARAKATIVDGGSGPEPAAATGRKPE